MPETKIQYKELPPCDILVAGGGTSGVAAAVSAARAGANVVLIEKNTFLGGLATGGLVTPMMKNALDAKNILTKGIYLEICERLLQAGGGAKFNDGNPGWFNPEIYKCILDEICLEAKVQLIFDSEIFSVSMNNIKEKNVLEKIFLVNRSGCFSISAKQFIDCTGDGILIYLSGSKYESGENGKRQAVSLRFTMGGVNVNELAGYLKENDKTGDSPVYFTDSGDILLSTAFTFEKDWTLKSLFEKALNCGDLTKEEAAYFQIFSVPLAKDLIAFNCPRLSSDKAPLNPLDFNDVNISLINGRKMIFRISTFVKKYLPGFQNAYIAQIAPMLGIRESRRLLGQYVLNSDDILKGRKFKNGIAASNWPIDIHPSNSSDGSQLKFPPLNDYYQIPIESLLPNEVLNLIVAGRLLSATFEAQGSARIQPNCFAMGEAAGHLAYKRIKKDKCHDVSL